MENRVREYRKKNNITQRELADAIGVSRQTIITLEGKDYNPTLQLAQKLAEFFGTKISDLFILREL